LADYARWLQHDVGRIDFIERPPQATQAWKIKPGQQARVVLYYDEPRLPAVLERGRVLLLTTPMDAREPAWNTYGEKTTSFTMALWLMVVKHLGSTQTVESPHFLLGHDVATVTLPAGIAPGTFQLVGNQLVEKVSFDAKRQAQFRQAREPGVYTVLAGNDVISRFALNIAPEENDWTRLPDDAVSQVFGGDALRTREVAPTAGLWNDPTDLLPWLMLGVLLFLAAETWLSNRFYGSQTAVRSTED
jgi:hypothetical protein